MADFNPEWEVTVDSVKQMLDAQSPMLLIDVREPAEHAFCKLPSAVLVPLGEIVNRAEEIREMAGDRPIIAHCHHGGRSLRATAALRQAGLANVKSMSGGIDEWSVKIDPRVPRYK